jgi:hypothetical protein
VHRNYNPDFVKGDILVEVKGFFRVGDTAKYKAIRDACLFKELVFFLQAPKTKIRKGAKMNMGQWCEKEGIKWFDDVEKLKEYATQQASVPAGREPLLARYENGHI